MDDVQASASGLLNSALLTGDTDGNVLALGPPYDCVIEVIFELELQLVIYADLALMASLL